MGSAARGFGCVRIAGGGLGSARTSRPRSAPQRRHVKRLLEKATQGLLVTNHEAEHPLHRATPSASYRRGSADVREASASPHGSWIRGVQHANGGPSAVDCTDIAPRRSSYRAILARMADRAIATEHPIAAFRAVLEERGWVCLGSVIPSHHLLLACAGCSSWGWPWRWWRGPRCGRAGVPRPG